MRAESVINVAAVVVPSTDLIALESKKNSLFHHLTLRTNDAIRIFSVIILSLTGLLSS